MQKPVILMAAIGALSLAALPAAAQDAAKPKAPAATAAKAADASSSAKQLYPQAFYDFLIKQRTSQGQPDSPELRAAVRDELTAAE